MLFRSRVATTEIYTPRHTLSLHDALPISRGIKKAVATSSFRELAIHLIERFGLRARFDAIVTGDDVKESKPDPAIFLEAARRVGVVPAECLVLEDAQNGVEAASNAGMRVYAIPHDDSRHHDFSRATRVIASMRDILPEFALH